MTAGNFCSLVNLVVVAIATLQLPALAQLPIPDSSTNTSVTPTAAGFDITGTTVFGQDPGLVNQFHSFQDFNVLNGAIADFIKFSPDVDNIITRVTGANASTIDGLLRANDANLFLINSNGLVFGPGADLDIGRSFFAVTASDLLFSDGVLFDTTEPTLNEFTDAVPLAFNFDANSGQINANGNVGTTIEVEVERTLALLGSRVTLTDFNLSAPTGRVELLGLGDQANSVNLTVVPVNINTPDRQAIGLSFDTPLQSRSNGIVSLTNSTISTTADFASDFNSSFLFDDTEFTFNSLNDAGGIVIRATEAIILDQQSTLEALSIGQGNAGFIGLQTSAAGEIQLRDGSIIFASVEEAGGQGGFVFLDTGDLTLTEASQVQTSVRDDVVSPDSFAGTIYITATGNVSLIGSDPVLGTSIFSSVGNPEATNTSANAGLVLLEANALDIDGRDGFAGITTSNNGQGGAGFIFIEVDTDVIVRGEWGDIISKTTSTIPNTSSINGQQPGVILIEARRVGLLNGGSVAVDNQGTGEPGLIGIEADLIAANRSLEGITARSTSGQGGLVILDSQFLALANSSNVETIATTDAGTSAANNLLKGIALFTDFEVIASPSADNNISTNADGAGAEAGFVFFISDPGVAPPFLRNIAVRDQAQPTSNDITFDGTGGATDGAILGEFSEFSSFQPTAEPAPDTVDPSRLIAQGCGSGDLTAAQNIGDLTLTGREGLSATPEEQLAGTGAPAELASLDDGDLVQADAWVAAQPQPATAMDDGSPSEAQTWRYGGDGQVVLAAHAERTDTAVFPGLTCHVF
ncbi:filamentous hemagglutinin N-terminal domain-containing protein [Leptothoe sp. PORK10 BA2]|uniref:filamentous hemagglutinin N-terminal domain-containing protein n=1 Tax=Leptothoe sp. PORK10 BA2 TaxID=3110254 RepID=UPI002B200A48|nr:filamentous hemagglutinin N-terminal domain-containing protein [Leptothoe sp. PORK10 BA2]MEA5463537.1 filamentous hemagglutinin N-terminal domain-containing protein [Leptothoe sp. PORK10 BA2]